MPQMCHKAAAVFFLKEELAVGNSDGNFNKDTLDRTKLHSLRGKLL